MGIKNSDQAIAKLTGEVHALYMFLQVLAKTHPNPALALSEFEKAGQQGLAYLEPHAIPDAVIDCYQEVSKAIRQALLANPAYSQKSDS